MWHYIGEAPLRGVVRTEWYIPTNLSFVELIEDVLLFLACITSRKEMGEMCLSSDPSSGAVLRVPSTSVMLAYSGTRGANWKNFFGLR